MPLQLAASPDLSRIDYPELLWDEAPEQRALDDDIQPQYDDGWEAACQWLQDRRLLADMNQWEIGWQGQRIVKRYGEASRAKWAVAGGYKPGTIGRYVAVASHYLPWQVRQIATEAPQFSFKHAEFLAQYKETHDWEEVMDVIKLVNDYAWSAEVMRRYLTEGDTETDEDDTFARPMQIHGILHFDETWIPDPNDARLQVKKAAAMILMDDDAVQAIITRAVERGFDGQFVEVLIKFPKDE